jgi:hypothetical protein
MSLLPQLSQIIQVHLPILRRWSLQGYLDFGNKRIG